MKTSNNPVHKLSVIAGAVAFVAFSTLTSCTAVQRKLAERDNSPTQQQQQQQPQQAQAKNADFVQPEDNRKMDESGILLRDAQDLLASGNFRALEKKAENARNKKERFTGGAWKLYVIYLGLHTPREDKATATDAEWEEHFIRLKKWKEKYPESITASVSLAYSYATQGWRARGSEFIHKVSRENLQLFKEKIALAKAELLSSKDFAQKCPQWYDVMLNVAQAESADPEEFNAIFDEAIAYEPLYFYTYRTKAYYLLPQWFGNPGDWQRFAVEASDKLGGEEGAAMYYFIVAHMLEEVSYDSLRTDPEMWPKLKSGYAALESRYGTNSNRVNDLAYMAMRSSDLPTACAMMAKLSDGEVNTSLFKNGMAGGLRAACVSIEKQAKQSTQIAKEKMPPKNEQHP